MASKESLAVAEKFLDKLWAIYMKPDRTPSRDVERLADLLDEAIREARETTMQSAIQIATGYANIITSPFCREKIAIADCMIGAAKEIERALLVRLAQLREGKT